MTFSCVCAFKQCSFISYLIKWNILNFIPNFNYFWNIKILFNLWDERKASCSRYLPQSWLVNEGEMGMKCLETFALNRDKGVSSLEDISEASILSIGQLKMEGAIVFVFGLHSALLHPRFQPPISLCRVRLSPSIRRGKGRSYEESIMELFKFVSNIEISFMPGELIIEVYRRRRRRLRMPGIVRARNGRGEKWTFCFSLDYCFLLPEPISIPPSSLSRLFISPRGNEDVFSASRRRFPFNFSRSREVPTPVGMAHESKENCRLKKEPSS